MAEDLAIMGGFHTPLEKTVLTTLLCGQGPLIICPARSLEKMRVPADWQPHLASGRLLLLSPFAPEQNRATQATADQRNQLVAALAPEVFIAYAAPGGKTATLALELLAAGRQVATFASPHNQHLIDAGAGAC
jgi:predicted Rossmann fold nucleotide-binding protein DprA/Smf involved in DNA uptake